ncbi:hypothetical protein [Puia dinghuensis]|uniref:Uncharacterized protein n=1 Tax=Puia dinghuensis TaxID=1792502 RepID=A0A8J2XXU3_9BACT|nr:hypothetical protein [Puia dinghuensis]GGB25112.1 hypothetical protein GCM10011511_56320 [Puia dinghuensis]
MMTLLLLHSWWRWMVLTALLVSIARSARGMWAAAGFTPFDNTLRHWTATIAHIQLVLGMTLFVKNPVADRFRLIHITGMIIAVTVVTIGSAMAKRKTSHREKFMTMLRWFVAALVIILLFIPWPWSPLAQRPLFRTF